MVRAISFYLPQYHPIPENDEWWGKGFTEWTNVAKAKRLFIGHRQPNLPADLGFYDLRVPETREAQADLARAHGIEAFCYWHYWFAGRRLLERPFEEVLRSGSPDFPFCLGWANHSWTGVWYGAGNRILIEQTYPGMDDHRRHFDYLLRAFSDHRYVRVEGKPLLLIFQPYEIPESRRVFDLWRDLASRAGLPGLHIVAHLHDADDTGDPVAAGYDAATIVNIKSWFINQGVNRYWRLRRGIERVRFVRKLVREVLGPTAVVPYGSLIDDLICQRELPFEYYPCALPNWDNTPRSGMRGTIVTGSTPDLYRRHLMAAIARVGELPSARRIIFIKSWNEWAEGNYLEPDLRWGRAYLEVTRDVLTAAAVRSPALAFAARTRVAAGSA
jgi:lipopolysaccharide biosynthesis protein